MITYKSIRTTLHMYPCCGGKFHQFIYLKYKNEIKKFVFTYEPISFSFLLNNKQYEKLPLWFIVKYRHQLKKLFNL